MSDEKRSLARLAIGLATSAAVAGVLATVAQGNPPQRKDKQATGSVQEHWLFVTSPEDRGGHWTRVVPPGQGKGGILTDDSGNQWQLAPDAQTGAS